MHSYEYTNAYAYAYAYQVHLAARLLPQRNVMSKQRLLFEPQEHRQIVAHILRSGCDEKCYGAANERHACRR